MTQGGRPVAGVVSVAGGCDAVPAGTAARPMPGPSALWRCFLEGGLQGAAPKRGRGSPRRHDAHGDWHCVPLRVACANDLPFGWRPVRLGPSPIGRGRRNSWRPPQPADEACLGRRRAYNIARHILNANMHRPAGKQWQRGPDRRNGAAVTRM